MHVRDRARLTTSTTSQPLHRDRHHGTHPPPSSPFTLTVVHGLVVTADFARRPFHSSRALFVFSWYVPATREVYLRDGDKRKTSTTSQPLHRDHHPRTHLPTHKPPAPSNLTIVHGLVVAADLAVGPRQHGGQPAPEAGDGAADVQREPAARSGGHDLLGQLLGRVATGDGRVVVVQRAVHRGHADLDLGVQVRSLLVSF